MSFVMIHDPFFLVLVELDYTKKQKKLVVSVITIDMFVLLLKYYILIV